MTVRAVDAEPVYYDPYDYRIDTNPHPVWQRMREEQPLYWNEKYGFWGVSRFEDVWSAYHHTETFSSTHGVQLEPRGPPVPCTMQTLMYPPARSTPGSALSRPVSHAQRGDL